MKTRNTSDWNWPKKINRAQVTHLFRMGFLPEHSNVILLGSVGVGKTQLAIALAAAQATGGMKRKMA
ncbi:MAG: ATP-binding protein [Azonexus sp.]